jgi:Ca2+-binding RTX toxin-like protein
MLRTFGLTTIMLLTGAAAAPASTSHDGWPTRNGELKIAPNSDTTFAGTARNDELLGGHGSDTLHGRAGDDVLWGDKNPGGQPTSQSDRIEGNAGHDFLYASHGRNVIDGGPGPDVVHAHFGHGTIDCGSGKDILFVSHRSKRGYKIRHCEKISFKTVGY